MVPALFFYLLSAHLALNPLDQLHCRNMKEFSDEDKQGVLLSLDFSSDAFEDSKYINRGKYGKTSAIISSNKSFYLKSVRYNIGDGLLSQQFEFHRAFFKELQHKNILEKNILCFFDEKWGYFMSKEKHTSINDMYSRPKLTPEQIKIGIFKMMKIFKIIEESKGVVTDMEIELVFQLAEENLQWKFSDLVDVCEEGKDCYIGVNYLPSVIKALGLEGKVLTNEKGTQFIVENKNNKMHRAFFALFISNTIKRNNAGVNFVKEDDVLINLMKRVADLSYEIKTGRAVFTWGKMKKFIEVWGGRGEFVNEAEEDNDSPFALYLKTANSYSDPLKRENTKSPTKITRISTSPEASKLKRPTSLEALPMSHSPEASNELVNNTSTSPKLVRSNSRNKTTNSRKKSNN